MGKFSRGVMGHIVWKGQRGGRERWDRKERRISKGQGAGGSRGSRGKRSMTCLRHFRSQPGQTWFLL